ncbi:MAG: hypothetical protein JW847_01200 [Candidatus Omnitrophica bacterium]|nr:hypothetical protein [Candidatus Omnitrophota bacterium]
MITTPYPAEAEQKSPPKNRIYPEQKTLNENRPASRTHPYGGTLVWGDTHQPTIINPILTTTSASAVLVDLIFDSLVRIDSNGKIVPGLAKSWDISKDGLVYTFYLQEGVLFHDGVELTAEDVKFTYEQIANPKNNSPFRSHFELAERFEVVDKYIFQIVLKESFPPLLYKLDREEIIPKHILEGTDINETTFNYHPIGTGSFKFKDWNKETNQIELEANLHYFEGKPYLDKFIAKIYSDNSQLWAAFMRREVDLMFFINREDYSIIERDPAFRAYAVAGSMYYAIVYNLDDPVWHDRELRQAIALGLNIEQIMKDLPGVDGIKATGPFHPDSPGYNQEVKPFEFDPVKARMMLMHRGWLDMPQDARGRENSVRRKNGRELELRMLVDERNDTYKRMARIIRQQLAEIGIKAVILLYNDENELTQEYFNQNKPQAWLRLFQGFGPDPYEAAGSWYGLSSQFGNLWAYRNRQVDELFESGMMSVDHDKRSEIYKKIHKLIYEDQPACFLFYPAGYFAVNSDFKNTDEYFSLYMPNYMMKDWYISKN